MADDDLPLFRSVVTLGPGTSERTNLEMYALVTFQIDSLGKGFVTTMEFTGVLFGSFSVSRTGLATLRNGRGLSLGTRLGGWSVLSGDEIIFDVVLNQSLLITSVVGILLHGNRLLARSTN